ncbi:LOW QUALITY PROTEIN: hypothetical protein Cgig2_016445 [Carnegiea gigantea]|uniref:Uncharacterized protein n=1 Tax=Carnegiea gigantea TaxID=171969 RepID=A0A9Q1K635_9CARY|nr:LOW QUALITY PROTEIN: hypothetical protein Cgig2_016445 [Carnegiea gigantea]
MKSLMSSMADAIMRQVSEQVKRAMEVASSAKPVHEKEPSHRPKRMPSLRPMERNREVARSDRSDQLPPGRQGACSDGTCCPICTRENGKQEPAPPPPRDEEYSTEVVATIVGGYVKEITRSAWKAQLRSAQQVLTKVNSTRMIRLPMRFGDKSKFKSLDVDFLVVDIPTAYNGDGDYTSGSPPSSRPSSSDAPASASKGLVASSSAASPSDEGGINSTSSGSRPSAVAHSCLSIKCRPQNIGHLKIRLRGLARPCGGSRGRRSGLAGSPAPCLDRISRGLLQLTLQLFLFGLPAASHSVSNIERRAPPAADTLRRPLPLWQRHQPWPSPPRRPLGGLKPQGPPSPRRELDARVPLDEVGEGCRVNEQAPLATGFAAPAPLEGGSAPLMTGSPIGEQTDGRPSPPTYEGADAPVSQGGPLVLCFLRTGKLTVGLFPQGTREGACQKKFKSMSQEKLREERRIRSYTIPFWPAEQQGATSLPPAYARQRSPLVRDLEDCQPSPRLICIKQTGSQVSTKHKTGYTTPSPWSSWGPSGPWSGTWFLGPSCGSERVGAPGNSNPSATISVTGDVRPFCLGTEPRGPNDDSVGELVEAPSEDKLREECQEAKLGEPYREECALDQQLVRRLDTGSRLRLCHPTNLEVRHIVSYGDLPRVRHLHLRAKNAGGGGVLTPRPRGHALAQKGE